MKLVNKRAKRDYKISEKIEAGIVLTGAEVKSLREGRGSLVGSFAKVKNQELWLYNFVIPAYQQAGVKDYDPARVKKLLMHKKEILAIYTKMRSKRLVLVPLACYTTKRFLKVRLGLGKGKKEYEKREAKKRKDMEREIERTLKGMSR